MIVDVFVFRTFNRAIRRMPDMAGIVDEARVDAKHGVLFVLSLYYVADSQSSNVCGVFKISRIHGLEPNFVENLSALGPGGEHAGGSSRLSPRDEFLLVVLLGTSNSSVLYNILNNLRDLGLGKGKIDDEPHSVLGCVFFTRCKVRNAHRNPKHQCHPSDHCRCAASQSPMANPSTCNSSKTRLRLFHRLLPRSARVSSLLFAVNSMHLSPD